MPAITPLDHHDILVLLIQIALLLVLARALGEMALRVGQPAVVGEILAGIVLGPSLLSTFVPWIGEWVIPQSATQGHLLEAISLLGALFLLLITGLETDLALIRYHARTAIGVSVGGILVTFASGFALGQWLPDFLLADPQQRLVFSLFVATAMSISAIPVIAKVLMDLDLMRRDVGQTILAAGMSDDTTGWILLSIVAGLAAGGAVTPGSVLKSVGSVLLFLILSFTAGRWFVKRALDYVQDEVRSQDRLLTLVVAFTLIWGAMTQALGLEAVLGAFVMGILFGQMPRLPVAVHHRLESLALGIFAPVFFATAGLKVNLLTLLTPQLLAISLLVIAVATGGKVVGTYLGARLIGGRDHWTSLSFGAGLNARGAMEIIIATIGLSLGILTQEMFSIIVLMAMATSLMAPTALRWVLARVEPGEQELARLEREALAAGSLVAGIHRVLVPVRGPQHIAQSARLIENLAATNALSVTLLHVAAPEERRRISAVFEKMAPLFPSVELLTKVVVRSNVAESILEEAKKDYDLLLLGAPERAASSEVLFSPMVDYLVRVAPCATMIVSGRHAAEHRTLARILVPTNGSSAARHAAELGFAISAREGSEVVVLNVIEQPRGTEGYDARLHGINGQHEIARGMVGELEKLGRAQSVATRGLILEGEAPEQVILDVAAIQDVDLIVLGTALRPGSARLFLGPRVERILESAPCPVVVLNTP